MIKIIAVLSMLIDHIGFLFFPEQDWFRIVGRLAFPLFAYQIAQGIIHTSNIQNYMKRLFIFGLISIIPYYLAFESISPNMILTFFATVLLVYLWEKNKKMLAAIIFVVLYFLNVEYGWYGIITVLLLKERMYLLFIPLTVGKAMLEDWYIQLAAVLALPIIYAADWFEAKVKITINRWFFYWFYPVHLLVLYLIKEFV